MVIYTSKKYPDGKKEVRLLGGLFKKLSTPSRRRFYLMGIKLLSLPRLRSANKRKKRDNLGDLCRVVDRFTCEQSLALAVARQHQLVFPQFKNKHLGETALVLGSGPSLQYFEPIEGAKSLGMNAVYNFDKVRLDYYFCIDYQRIAALNDVDEFAKSDCIKFFGQHSDYYAIPIRHLNLWHVPTSFIEKCRNSYQFYVSQYGQNVCRDILTQPLNCFCSSGIFTIMDFAIWAGFKKIYIAGCDSCQSGYFYGNKSDQAKFNADALVSKWKKWAGHARILYPDVEIISLNPIGLKGLFKDVYTPSFLAAQQGQDVAHA